MQRVLFLWNVGSPEWLLSKSRADKKVGLNFLDGLVGMMEGNEEFFCKLGEAVALSDLSKGGESYTSYCWHVPYKNHVIHL